MPQHSKNNIARCFAGTATALWVLSVPTHAQNVHRAALTPARQQAVSFVNDVIPVLTRSGCNQGICHGAAVGKGGFKLSLRGYAPELDYAAIARQGRGRRISIAQPEQSLLLRKPLLELPHRGGAALRKETPDYAILTTWLKQGANGPSPGDPHVVRLDVLPASQSTIPKTTLNLRAVARFSDGSSRDVTYWARFGTNDENVATVQAGGKVRTTGSGETAITAGYQDKVAFARITIPFPNRTNIADYTRLPRKNYIDDLTYAKLVALHLWPSEPSGDAAFVRRLSLDLTGTLPTAEAIQKFATDRDSRKREKLLDALVQGPDFTDFWTYKWCDLFRVNRGTLKDKGMWAFYAWIHESVANNKPWDQMCREVMTATGNSFLDGPSNYFRTSQKTEELAENISQGFLGIRVQCARCHNHPLEKWTQNEYYGMANLFSRVGRKLNNDPWVNEEMIVYNTPTGDLVQPRLGHPVPPAPLGGPTLALDSQSERRAFFAAWLTSPANRQFARSIVNRVWAHFLGRGLVEPVDDLRDTNPATNPALLDALCDDFVKHRFDLRHLMRQIVTSQVYQLSSKTNPRNRQDDRYYSRYFVRRLTAETLLDALGEATGQPETFAGMPAGYRAIQLPDTKVKSEFMDSFGRPARQITCECERSQEPNMTQALLFINSESINKMVTADGGLVDRLIKAGKSDAEILDTLYWTALGRAPLQAERAANLTAIQRVIMTPVPAAPSADGKAPAAPSASVQPTRVEERNATHENPSRRRALEDMFWVLVNSKEFLFNH